MRLLIIGLDCAAPELLFGDGELVNLRRLMEAGCYGRLESVIPPITIPAWMCMATSRDPGTLGVYGFRNRADWSYGGLATVNSKSIADLAIWDQVAREGKKAHVIGVPPNFPPRKTSGCSIGCFLTPDTASNAYARPEKLAGEIRQLLGEDYRVDVRGFRTENKDWLKDEIYSMTRQHFQVIRHVMQAGEWDYLQFVEIGLDRVHHGFWKYQDATHRQHVPGNPYQHVVRDYYRYLDSEIGALLEMLDDDTAVLVLSDHGAQRLDGGFCVNEWLIEQGLLVLNKYPEKPTPMLELDVNWDRTVAWSEGGYYARVFLNVKGREPHGLVKPEDYERVRDDLKARFEATVDDRGKRMATRGFKPQEIYRQVRNLAPDLIVHFDNLYWRSVGKVGYRTIHVQENDTGPDDCNHAQYGAFILAAPGCSVQGQLENVHLLDLAPTLLELGGYDPLPEMQGKSIVRRHEIDRGDKSGVSQNEEEIIRQRLSGLGYV
jgi:predicted AlkP superfamily phosphohydrolase/phosphomutase